MVGAPPEAVECNARSLQELNAYIDRLESLQSVTAPFVARAVVFFNPVLNRKGERVTGRVRPCTVSLESIPPSADLLEKEEISIDLIRRIELSMTPERMFRAASRESEDIEPIIKSSSRDSSSSVRSELNKIFDAEAHNSQLRDSIFGAVDDRLSQYRNYQSINIYNKLMKKYLKVKNFKRRQKRMSNIEEQVEELLQQKNVGSSLDMIDASIDPSDEAKIKVIESGFHPDLVFFDPSLTADQREEGIARVCGINLSAESDSWLLENVWKVVRKDKSPSVPIVLSVAYKANPEGGCLEIPFDFQLTELVDFLEDNLEPVRDSRRQLLADFRPV